MRAVIVGSGIGGLAMAHELLHAKKVGKLALQSVRVLEASAKLEPELGAGFTLSGGLACLSRLPALSALGGLGARAAAMRQMRRDGTVINDIGLASMQTAEAPMAQFMRDELQQALAAALPDGVLECGKKVTEVDMGASLVRTADGESCGFDVLIGADGINSMVRQCVFGKPNDKQYSGISIEYCAIPADAVRRHPDPRFAEATIVDTLGDGCTEMTFPCGRDGATWTYARAYRAAAPPTEAEWGSDPAPLGPDAPEAARHASRVMRFGLFQTPPRSQDQWHRANAVLIGDAAHATTPFMGQGANQAIQDAACLTRLLHESPSVEAALEAYAQRREPPTSRIIGMSNAIGKIRTADSWLTAALRIAMYRIVGFNDGWLLKKRLVAENRPIV